MITATVAALHHHSREIDDEIGQESSYQSVLELPINGAISDTIIVGLIVIELSLALNGRPVHFDRTAVMTRSRN